MTPVLVILVVVALFATLGARKGAPNPAPRRERAARRKTWSPYWLLGAVLLGIVLVRFGNWMVVAAGMVAAALRGLLPLLRFLPLLESVRRATSARSSAHAGAPWGASGAGGEGAGPSSEGSRGSRRPERMSRQEALQVLGLDERATSVDVQREYRRLMRKIHPDLGGSSYLAAKLNEAKDVLS